jgi:hypothetical protein
MTGIAIAMLIGGTVAATAATTWWRRAFYRAELGTVSDSWLAAQRAGSQQ